MCGVYVLNHIFCQYLLFNEATSLWIQTMKYNLYIIVKLSIFVIIWA